MLLKVKQLKVKCMLLLVVGILCLTACTTMDNRSSLPRNVQYLCKDAHPKFNDIYTYVGVESTKIELLKYRSPHVLSSALGQGLGQVLVFALFGGASLNSAYSVGPADITSSSDFDSSKHFGRINFTTSFPNSLQNTYGELGWGNFEKPVYVPALQFDDIPEVMAKHTQSDAVLFVTYNFKFTGSFRDIELNANVQGYSKSPKLAKYTKSGKYKKPGSVSSAFYSNKLRVTHRMFEERLEDEEALNLIMDNEAFLLQDAVKKLSEKMAKTLTMSLNNGICPKR